MQDSKAGAVQSEFVPALRYKWATGLYDWLMEAFVKERELRERTITAIHSSAGETIVDFGCGTGSLLKALHQHKEGVTLVGLDLDKDVLEIAERKFAGSPRGQRPVFFRANLTADLGSQLTNLPKADCLVSSLVFHHLTTEQKRKAFKNAAALVKPGGRFILVDWGPGSTLVSKIGFMFVRLFDGLSVTRANAKGMLPSLMTDAGFQLTTSRPLLNTVFGTIWLHEGQIH